MAAADYHLTVASADELSAADRREIVDLCSAAFQEEMGRLFELLPGSRHVLARRGRRLVGHACWVERWLQPAGMRPLRTAYVEAVATDPALHGRGIGSAVMRRVADEIRGWEVGGLSPARESFYRRLGWETWRGPTAVRMGEDVVPTPGEEVMVLRTPLTPPLDLDAAISVEWRQGEVW
jgi:aminoglycoside 2'-N-acetyltransferase I